MTISVEEKPELVELLHRRIEEAGGIDFAEFMEHCLYHPEYGYYTTPRTRIGKEGDFFTSSSVHSMFGRLISRQLVQMWQLLGEGDFTIAEQGAGEGHLCLDILDALAEEAPEFYQRLKYRIVEISPDHRSGQNTKLKRHVDAGRVEWCTIDQLQGMEGCYLSNELVDAFPVHLVDKNNGELKEIFVVNSEKGFVEDVRPLENKAISDYFELVEHGLLEGNRGEVNLQALSWMKSVARVLKRGFVLTIDYGYPAKELYAPFRRNGTLLCYHKHQSNENPYQRVGCQDITAHIDFTALQKVGEQNGLDSLYLGDQCNFLLGVGFLEALMELQMRTSDPQEAQAIRMTLKNLIMPEGGMGESFKVLVQGKDVGQPDLLCARKISDIRLPPGAF
ncbi:SAM-dependent methyltransferase, MidA family [Malonomonas rubra DSM 5091]|uniref:SAM-dependent methyltransferase, MidA family n=1 Tax=Malonomonas rubra DSM 5091 TaxID=1122189 RepID=A0A1M6M4S0_MALRU|nr:SAM-dependent methyltransferase [Malonomonas rubra]SHJ78474.1 SAM-dependent methyltransferase, MidA family [Malonomonas rubra DSM 5091]